MREKNKTQIGGIYQILNKIDGKFYIGSAVYIKGRFGKDEDKKQVNDLQYQLVQACK